MKNEREIFNKFYSPRRILSYGRPIMFSIGSRSIGKSTGWACFILSEFLDYGKQWMYIRRTVDEMQETARTWFDNAAQILAAHGYDVPPISYKGGVYKVGDAVAGYAAGLSIVDKLKSSNFSGVFYIVYDEFLPRNGIYLGGAGSMREVDDIASIFQTIDRGIGKAARNETSVIFLGNAYSFFNPFFIHYGIDKLLRTDTKYLAPKGEIYVVEQTKATEATADIEKSVGYKMSTEATKLSAYANKMTDTGGVFVKKITAPMQCVFNISWQGDIYGVYMVPRDGVMYVSTRPGVSDITIAATTGDHRPNYLLLTHPQKFDGTGELLRLYDMGLVYFSDAKAAYMLANYAMYFKH